MRLRDRLLLLSVVSAFGTAACSDSGTLGPTGPLELEADTLVISALGDTAVVRATRDGTAASISLTPLRESPWTSRMPVSEAIGGPNVIALGAGQSLYQVESAERGGSKADTVVVVVSPTEPYVARIESTAAVGPGSPFVIHGFGLADLPPGAVTANGDTAVLTERDSASVTATLPVLDGAECISGASALDVSDADVLTSDLTLYRQRNGAIALPVGGTQRLTSAEASCIMVDAPSDAEFGLVYFDGRHAVSTERLGRVEFSITVADAIGGARSSVAAEPLQSTLLENADDAAAGGVDRLHYASATTTGDEWKQQTTPFRVGDTLDIKNALWANTQWDIEDIHEVLVVAVVDDYLTVGVPVDSMQGQTDELLPFFLELVAELDARHLDWLTGLFARPSLANGQYMILLYPESGHFTAMGKASRGWHAIRLTTKDLDTPGVRDRAYDTLVHEYGHSIQSEYARQQVGEFGATPMRELWSAEGTPTFLAKRASMEFAGQSIGSNVHPGRQGDPTEVTPLGSLAYNNQGSIEFGYGSAANLGFDFAWRLAEASGLRWEAAFDSVALGMHNNRYGCISGGDCDTFDGLFDLMSRHMGPEWNPVDAVLTFTASQVLDDHVESPLYRNPYIEEAGTYSPGLGPQAAVSANSGDFETIQSKPSGSTGWALLSGGHGTYEVSSTADHMAWLLIRIR